MGAARTGTACCCDTCLNGQARRRLPQQTLGRSLNTQKSGFASATLTSTNKSITQQSDPFTLEQAVCYLRRIAGKDFNAARTAAFIRSLQDTNQTLKVSLASARATKDALEREQMAAADAGQQAAQRVAASLSSMQTRLLEEHGQRERASTELSHLQARHESTVQESAEEASRLRTQLQQAEAALAEERQKHAATQDRLEQERSGAGADRAAASSHDADQSRALAEAKQQLRDTVQAYSSCKGRLEAEQSQHQSLQLSVTDVRSQHRQDLQDLRQQLDTQRQEHAQLQRQLEHATKEQHASGSGHEQDRVAWQADVRARQHAASNAEEALRCCQADRNDAMARLVACQDQCARHEAVLAQSKQQAGAEAEQLGRQLQASRGQAGQLQQEISGLSRALSAAQTGLEQSLAQRSATEQAHAAQLGQATARIDRLEERCHVLTVQLQAASEAGADVGPKAQHAAVAKGLPELQSKCAQQEMALQRAAMEAHGLAAELQCAREEMARLEALCGQGRSDLNAARAASSMHQQACSSESALRLDAEGQIASLRQEVQRQQQHAAKVAVGSREQDRQLAAAQEACRSARAESQQLQQKLGEMTGLHVRALQAHQRQAAAAAAQQQAQARACTLHISGCAFMPEQEVVTALTLPPPGIFQSSQMLIEAKKRRSEAPSDTQALLGQKLWAG